MGRCGCSTECTCDLQAGCGITVTETGTDGDYEISLNPKSAAGDGLKTAGGDCRLAVDLAPGGGIEHDTNGALYNAEAADDFDPSNASIPGLLSSRRENKDIVGAWLTGYWYKPQSTRAAITWAAERGHDLLHLPVRMAQDGTPIVTPDEYLGRQNGNTQDFGRDTGVQNQLPTRLRKLVNKVGTNRPDQGGKGSEDPRQGWFGYLETTEIGLVTLGEAVDLVDRRVPMIWDILWPSLDGDQWSDGHAPPKERVTAFIRHLKLLLRRDKANSRVIVTSQHPTVPHDGDTLNLFDQLAASNVGVTLSTRDDAKRLSPDALGKSGEKSEGNGTSWVIANKQIPAKTLKPYADAGHNVLLANLTRHVHVDKKVGPSGAIGVLSGDPEYTAGHYNTHPVYAGYPYRQRVSTFHQTVVHHGWIPTREQWHNRVHPNQRGYCPRYDGKAAHGGQYVIPRQVGNLTQGQYWVLQGWASPVQSDEWVMTLWLNVHRNYEAAKRLVTADVCFCRDTDAPIPPGGLSQAADTSGYVLSYRTSPQGKSLQLFAVDDAEGKPVTLKDWDVSGFDNTWTAVRIRVLKEGIRVVAINRDTGKPETEVYDSSNDQGAKKRLGTASRGGYVFFGRNTDKGDPGGKGDPESAAFAKVVIAPNRDDTPDNPPPGNGDSGDKPKPPPDDDGDGGNTPKPPPEGGNKPKPPPNNGGDGGNKPPPDKPKPPPPKTYTVQAGDTLSGIAQKMGADQDAIAKANGLDNPDAIREGDVLKIPR